MNIKKWPAMLAVSVLSAAFVSPSLAFATGGETVKSGQAKAAHESAPEEDSDDNADNADEGSTPRDTVSDGDSTDEPAEHNDHGDDANDQGDDGSCTSVSSVAVCVDQPRN